MQFVKSDIDALRRLTDYLVSCVGNMEPDEVEAVNKMYEFLNEEEANLNI